MVMWILDEIVFGRIGGVDGDGWDGVLFSFLVGGSGW